MYIELLSNLFLFVYLSLSREISCISGLLNKPKFVLRFNWSVCVQSCHTERETRERISKGGSEKRSNLYLPDRNSVTMGGHGDHVSTFEDWGAPSPSPRTFFSSILADDISSKSMLENNNMLFSGSSEGYLAGPNGNIDKSNSGFAGGETTKQDMYFEQKMNSRGGLVERMAARAGSNAPKLNTEDVRPTIFSQNQDVRSPYLTIPPGLSPTTLLESPVFLSNALAQPSPTTGNFPFTFGGFDTRSFSADQNGPPKNRENFYGDINTSSFAFKPVLDSGPSSFLGPTSKNFPGFEVSKGTVVSSENLSPPDDGQDEENNQPSGGDPLPGGTPTEDGYNWRKYGQKQVKGSEYPRSYYKCTNLNCLVKKKVERSQEGHITEIIYKGAHNHHKPPPNRRSVGAMISDTQADDSIDVTSSESVEAVVDRTSAFSNDDNGEEDDGVTHGSVSLGCDGEEDESESKRRKIEAYAADVSGATRAIREPRVVVQTTSEVDILDDGYRWRKYGQKVVKGNPNPRSYYKCTHVGCAVRKHVERASHDLKSVITTYEGKHNHEVPAARNSSHLGNGPTHLQRSDPAQLHTAMPRFDNRMGSYARQQQQQQLGSTRGFSFGMNQSGFANLAMAGLGPDRSKFPVMPEYNTYMGQQLQQQQLHQQQQNYNEMGFMLPKGEPKVEPLVEAPMNRQNGSSGYHQMMSRLPLGP